jgi:hypothetical protein
VAADYTARWRRERSAFRRHGLHRDRGLLVSVDDPDAVPSKLLQVAERFPKALGRLREDMRVLL